MEKAKCKNCTDEMIEEMAKVIIQASCKGSECETCAFTQITEAAVGEITATCFCLKALYNAGYRKIPEGSVVLSREEYQELKQTKTLLEFREETIKYLEDANIRYAEALELKVNKKERKETAKEFAEKLENGTLIDMPRIIHPNKTEWHVQYQCSSGVIQYYICFSEAEAEAILKELKGEV